MNQFYHVYCLLMTLTSFICFEVTLSWSLILYFLDILSLFLISLSLIILVGVWVGHLVQFTYIYFFSVKHQELFSLPWVTFSPRFHAMFRLFFFPPYLSTGPNYDYRFHSVPSHTPNLSRLSFLWHCASSFRVSLSTYLYLRHFFSPTPTL